MRIGASIPWGIAGASLTGEISPSGLLERVLRDDAPVQSARPTSPGRWRRWTRRCNRRLLVPPRCRDRQSRARSNRPDSSRHERHDHCRGLADVGTPRFSRRVSRGSTRSPRGKALGREPVIHANGYMCRESFSVATAGNFTCSAPWPGLGIGPGCRSRTRHRRRSCSTAMGIFDEPRHPSARRGASAEALRHIVSTTSLRVDGQPAIDQRRDSSRPAAVAAGYRTVAAVTAADEITQAVRTALDGPGPHLHPCQGDHRGSLGPSDSLHTARASRSLPRERARVAAVTARCV